MTKRSPCAGLIVGPQEHHLDHIGTLCALLDLPLIVTEPEIEHLAKQFYPQLVVFQFLPSALAKEVVSQYQAVLSSIPSPLFQQIFRVAETIYRKKIFNIWCPHGNSDKGDIAPFFESLQEEYLVLVYGQNMIDTLKKKGGGLPIENMILIGNYRLLYYHKLKQFYDKCTQQLIFSKMSPKKKTLLYAPSWEDAENSGTLFSCLSNILKFLPENYQILIKIHPNTLLQRMSEYETLKAQYSSSSSIYFIEHFPPIYPLLEHIDLYLGDMSSVGYDFLYYNKPMIFLSSDPSSKKRTPLLFQCGRILSIEEIDRLPSLLEDEQKDLSEQRKNLYSYTFAQEVSPSHFDEKIQEAIRIFLEEGFFF